MFPKSRRRLPRQSRARGAGPGQNQHRHGVHNPQPAPPARQLQQIIRPHQPDEFLARKPPPQLTHGIRAVLCAQSGLDIGRYNPPPIGNPPGRGEPLRKRRHAGFWFQRVAGGDHQPELVQPEMAHGLARDMQMPLMRRVERTPEQADAQGAAASVPRYINAQLRICPVPRTT
jgi:hypothetical protein